MRLCRQEQRRSLWYLTVPFGLVVFTVTNRQWATADVPGDSPVFRSIPAARTLLFSGWLRESAPPMLPPCAAACRQDAPSKTKQIAMVFMACTFLICM